MYSEPGGQLAHRDSRSPNEASYVLKVDGPPRSATFAGDTLLVTSASGEPRASSVSLENGDALAHAKREGERVMVTHP